MPGRPPEASRRGSLYTRRALSLPNTREVCGIIRIARPLVPRHGRIETHRTCVLHGPRGGLVVRKLCPDELSRRRAAFDPVLHGGLKIVRRVAHRRNLLSNATKI